MVFSFQLVALVNGKQETRNSELEDIAETLTLRRAWW